MRYKLTYRWRGGSQVIETQEWFATKESAFLALARDIVGLAETSDRASLDRVELWLDPQDGRRLARIELDAGAMAEAFEKEDRR